MVYLLPAILPPGVMTRKNKSSKNIKYERSTILDSQLNFILKADSTADLSRKLEVLHNQCLSEQIKLQPLLATIGDKEDYREFFVILDSTKFKFGSFLEALDFCFKTFNVLNLCYPNKCISCWMFIQLYLYEINTKYDVNIPAVDTLINDLNNMD